MSNVTAAPTDNEFAGRVRWAVDENFVWEDAYGNVESRGALVPDADGPLVSSVVGSLEGRHVHAPVIDIDFHARLEPSSTPGHFHLYLDRPVTWRAYKRILRSMVKAGLVDKEWYRLAKFRRMTVVRGPGSRKGTVPSRASMRR